MERVNREERRDGAAPPHRSCHPGEREEEKKDVEDVDDKAGDVMSAGVKSVELAVGHVRYHRQRDVHPEEIHGKSVPNVLPRQALLDEDVFRGTELIVHVDELRRMDAPENDHGDQSQGSRNEQKTPVHFPFFARCFRRGGGVDGRVNFLDLLAFRQWRLVPYLKVKQYCRQARC